jgi:hypothetical protein
MKFEVKNVKHAAFASEDTLCMECTLYVDGKRTGLCNNDGRGGETYIRPADTTPDTLERLKKAQAWVKANVPPVVTDMTNSDGTPFTYEKDLEAIVDELVCDALIKKDMKKQLKKICIVHEGTLYTWPAKYKPALLNDPTSNARSMIASKYPGCVFMNDLSEDEALVHFKAATGA